MDEEYFERIKAWLAHCKTCPDCKGKVCGQLCPIGKQMMEEAFDVDL